MAELLALLAASLREEASIMRHLVLNEPLNAAECPLYIAAEALERTADLIDEQLN